MHAYADASAPKNVTRIDIKMTLILSTPEFIKRNRQTCTNSIQAKKKCHAYEIPLIPNIRLMRKKELK